MNKTLKNCLALFLITLIAGLALSSVNEITKEPIKNAEYTAKMEAYEVVYPDATFKEVNDSDNLIKKSVSILKENSLSMCTINDVLGAYKNNELVGYVFSSTSSSGYGGDIKIALGVSIEDESITGFTVLSNSETAGLGAKCTEDEFQSQFKGKSSIGISYSKTGAQGDTHIDAISGATYTTNAVTEATNAALTFYNNLLKES